MTGITLLDVFIGLTFLYLLFSLFATIILELINNILRLRAQNLAFTLKRMMLDEVNPKIRFIDKIKNKLFGTFGFLFGTKNENLFKAFINQPTIKYLSNGGLVNKPSYLSPTDFSKALIDSLKDSAPDEATKLEKIKTGISKLFPEGSETKKHILSLLDDAENDLERFKVLLENWFESTMERAIGWYKRRIQVILLALGMIIAFSLNLDTIKIAGKLSKDKNAREQMVNMSIAYMEANKDIIVKNMEINPSSTSQHDSITKAKIDTLLQVKKQVENDIANASKIIDAGWPDEKEFTPSWSADTSEANRKLFFMDKVEIALAKKDTLVGVEYPANIDKADFKKFILGKEYKKVYYRSSFKWWTWIHHFWGYLLTALAISVGAPFWFDLLNKLVKLRGSVAQSTTSTEGKRN
ncbi:MAG: hypothetical protein K9H64_06290 [Bacteroidales bacterium]|nr:hypothetical protein [Bacteroidales bacterium]MCF8455305.1 hypothetical protein [Bacteroidales bacterium]